MTRLFRLTALQLAICAMLLRALVPAGWMPNIGSDAGSGLFTICSVDAEHGDSGKDGQKPADRHEVCPFAATPHLATPVAAALPAPSLAVALEPHSPGRDAVALRTSHSSQAPRAPPALATI